MYEKKSKLTQPASIFGEISIRLLDAVYYNIMKNAPFFFKTLISDGCFGKYELNMPSRDDIWTLSLLRRVCLPNSTTRILFSIV